MQEKNNAENPYFDFIRKKITDLRLAKNVSEYQMSYDLGKSKGYIQSISSKKALPSMEAFLDICAYFDITPYEFFDIYDKRHKNELENLSDRLSNNDLELLINIANRLADKN